MWYVPTMEYYPAFERKELLSRAAAWMNLEDIDIMLGEINELQKGSL